MELYSKDGTLYHHGVKGMKWGVRKARKVYDKAIDIERRKNKRDYNLAKLDNVLNPKRGPADTIKRQRELKSNYEHKDAKLAYKQARNKAQMDPEYKNSNEYRKIKQAHTKVVVSDILRSIGDSQTTKRS